MTVTVAVGLRVVAAMAAGARPAARSRSRVVHLYVGHPSRSGRFASTTGRCLCGVGCRLMPLVEPVSGGLDLGGRRFCRRCTSLLPASLGRDVHRLVTPDETRAAYGHLTVDDFRQAAAWTRTVEETHQVSRIAGEVLGPPQLYGTRDVHAQAVYDLHRLILRRRDRLRAAELSPEDREARAAKREADADDRARIAASRRRAAAMDRAHERAKAGRYLTPFERQLIGA